MEISNYLELRAEGKVMVVVIKKDDILIPALKKIDPIFGDTFEQINVEFLQQEKTRILDLDANITAILADVEAALLAAQEEEGGEGEGGEGGV